MHKLYCCLYVCYYILLASANAQSPSTPATERKAAPTDSLKNKKDSSDSYASLLLEFDFGSNRGYELKRKTAAGDTSQKYISPSLTYAAKSGFYTSAAFYKTPGANKKWD